MMDKYYQEIEWVYCNFFFFKSNSTSVFLKKLKELKCRCWEELNTFLKESILFYTSVL